MRNPVVIALAALLGCGAPALAQVYPSRPITMVVGVRGRRRRRFGRPHRRRGHARLARPAGGDRERIRRRRQHRGRSRRPRGAGRLHGELRQLGHPCGQRRALSAAIRPVERPRSGRAGRIAADADHRQEGRPGEGPARTDRLAQGQSRQGVGRERRREQRLAHRRHVLPEGIRDRAPARPLPRRIAGDPGYRRAARSR